MSDSNVVGPVSPKPTIPEKQIQRCHVKSFTSYAERCPVRGAWTQYCRFLFTGTGWGLEGGNNHSTYIRVTE